VSGDVVPMMFVKYATMCYLQM